ncbi:MAG: acyl-CoA thioesterase [Phycisphaerae bacterium]|nr:acyl-CoA thioesterase [Phycisphaerae bacterium]
MAAFKYRFRVKFDNVDYARVLYFPRQIDFFIEALEEFCLSRLGLSFRRMLDVDRIAMPTVHFEADYRRPLQFEEEAEVHVFIRKIGEKSITFGYETHRLPDHELTSTATQIVATVDFDTWNTIPVPARYREMLSPYVEPAM